MHMWDSTTCTCGAVKHVHVKQDSLPGKGTFLSEKDKVQYRVRGSILSMDTSAIEKTRPSSSSFLLLKITINTLILIFFTTCLFTLIFSSPLHVTIRPKRVF